MEEGQKLLSHLIFNWLNLELIKTAETIVMGLYQVGFPLNFIADTGTFCGIGLIGSSENNK